MTDVETSPSATSDDVSEAQQTIVEQATVKDRSARPSLASRVGPVVVFFGFIGFWYFMHYVVLSEQRRFILPTPHKVIQKGFIDGVTADQLWNFVKRVLSDLLPFADVGHTVERNVILIDNLHALWITIEVSILGLLVATILGALSAMAMAQAKWVEAAFFPYAVLFQAIPILALVPLIGNFAGFGFTARVIVCVLISFFPIVANTLFGLKAAEQGQHDLFALHTSSRITKLRKLLIPAALPAFFTGLRISAGLSVIGSIVGGYFFQRGEPDIGSLLFRYFSRADNPELFAAIIMSSALGIGVFIFFGWLSDRLIGKWSEESS